MEVIMKIEEIVAKMNDFVEEYECDPITGKSRKFKILNRPAIINNKLWENPNVPVDFQAKLSLFGGGSN
jgi:hypothetical protein